MDYIFLLVVINLFLLFLYFNKKKCNQYGGDGHLTQEQIDTINSQIITKNTAIRLLDTELEDKSNTTLDRKEQIDMEKSELQKEIKELENNLNNKNTSENTQGNTSENIQENTTITPKPYDASQDHLLNINNITKYMENWCNHNYSIIKNINNPDYNNTRKICDNLKQV